MAMETVLKQLESKIDELVEAYGASRVRVAELEQHVAELEARLSGLAEVEGRASSLENRKRNV